MNGVKYPKITTVGFVLKRPFVDVSSLCRSFLSLFFFSFFLSLEFFDFFVSGIFCFYFGRKVMNIFSHLTQCELVSRVEIISL